MPNVVPDNLSLVTHWILTTPRERYYYLQFVHTASDSRRQDSHPGCLDLSQCSLLTTRLSCLSKWLLLSLLRSGEYKHIYCLPYKFTVRVKEIMQLRVLCYHSVVINNSKCQWYHYSDIEVIGIYHRGAKKIRGKAQLWRWKIESRSKRSWINGVESGNKGRAVREGERVWRSLSTDRGQPQALVVGNTVRTLHRA